MALSKLAPVQAMTHGHPVTSGIDDSIMDYFISWEAAELPDAQNHYTEKLILAPADVPWEVHIYVRARELSHARVRTHACT